MGRGGFLNRNRGLYWSWSDCLCRRVRLHRTVYLCRSFFSYRFVRLYQNVCLCRRVCLCRSLYLAGNRISCANDRERASLSWSSVCSRSPTTIAMKSYKPGVVSLVSELPYFHASSCSAIVMSSRSEFFIRRVSRPRTISTMQLRRMSPSASASCRWCSDLENLVFDCYPCLRKTPTIRQSPAAP